MIKVDQLTKTFGDLIAVNSLSLTAGNGEITGLIGHNGAGKTTTFRILCGLMRPDDGTATIDDLNVVEDRIEAQRRLGVLPDVRGLYPRLTGREHLRYYGQLHGLDESLLEERISALISQLRMDDFADRRAKGYSRGQELKVALGRALIHEPSNLILDEPTNGLDVRSSRAVHDLIRERKAAGSAVLISSHIMSEVEGLCDRIVIIVEGHSVMEGTPEELKERAGVRDLEDIFLHVLADPATVVEAAE